MDYRTRQTTLQKQMLDGSKEAADQLARSIWPWAIRVASRTTHNLDHNQVNSAVNLAITKAIRAWKPGRGALTTYVTVAVRRQLEHDNATQTHVIYRPINPRYTPPVMSEAAHTTLHATIDHRHPADLMERRDDIHAVREAINNLKPRLKFVIILHHFRGKSLKEIGDRLNVSRERARQIEAEALEELYELLKHRAA